MIPDLRRFTTPDLLLRFLNPSPITPEFRGSGHTISQVPWFLISELRRFKIPDLHRFDHPATVSRFTRNSQIQLLFSHIIWKLISWDPADPTLRGWQGFTEFPNKENLYLYSLNKENFNCQSYSKYFYISWFRIFHLHIQYFAYILWKDLARNK
jgi:hypothetical protein